MDLDLVLAADAAARLLRLPLFGTGQRTRAQQQRIVWHDSADAVLSARGLALAQERGVWRLEKLWPGTAEVWPPGAPAPVVAQAETQEALGHHLPTPLAPVAAFNGRRQTLMATTEQGAAAAVIWRGAVRAVTQEHTICRLSLSGDDRAVLHVAMAVAETVPVAVASTTLAGTALAMARGTVPPARRHGPPELPGGLTIADAFAHMLGHFTDVLLHAAPQAVATGNRDPEPVHQLRVALRRLRSTMKLFQRVLDSDELRAVKAGLKTLNGKLGPARDWDVLTTETLPAVLARFPDETRLTRLAAAAGRRRQAYHAALAEFLEGDEFRRLGLALAWLAGAHVWRTPVVDESGEAIPLQAFAADVLDRRVRKLASVDDLAGLDPVALHAVRLEAKRARYAAETFVSLFPGKAAPRFIARVSIVQNLLGILNDATTAHRLLDELGGASGRHAYAAGLVIGFVEASGAQVLPQALRHWSKLHRARDFWRT